MFGSEQACVDQSTGTQLLYRLFGESRFPIRLRAYYLGGAIPSHFQPKRIWDAGCGQGQTSFWLARKYPNARITGTDIDARSVERCSQIAECLGVKTTTFIQRDLVGTSAHDDDAFDLIVCFEVLEHIVDFAGALKDLASKLSPHGLLVIHTPAAGRFQSDDFGLRRLMKNETTTNCEVGQFHVRPGFDLSELVEAVGEAGLRVLNVSFTFGLLAMLAHTVYEATRSHSKTWQWLSLPFLLALGWLDSHFTHKHGGAILLRAGALREAERRTQS